MAVTDIILLLIMLVGLLRLRRHGGNTFGLTHFLWKQVRWLFSLIAVIWLIDMFLFHKGVIWILLATVTEVPPAVSVAKSTLLSFAFISLLCSRYWLFSI